MHRVTAILKTFLRERYCYRCVRSLKQFYPEMHILVADDGRPNPYREARLKELGVEYYIQLPFHTPITAARNLLLDVCKTEYVLVGDDDFEYDADSHLERLLTLMDVADVASGAVMQGGVVGHYEGLIDPQVTPQTCNQLSYRPLLQALPGEAAADYLEHRGVRYAWADLTFNFFIGKTAMVRRARWEDRIHVCMEHLDFFLAAKQAGLAVAYCPDAVALHRGGRGASWADSPEYRRYRNHVSASRDHQVFREKWGYTSWALPDAGFWGR